jgi:type VI secretion system secreted protein Hcp
MAVYLKWPGVDGEVSKAPYILWIEVRSFQLGVSRNVQGGQGGGTGRAEAENIKEIIVVKDVDHSSAALYKEALDGNAVEAKIALTKGTDREEMEFERITLTEAVISYISHSGGDRPSETLTLVFKAVSFELFAGHD